MYSYDLIQWILFFYTYCFLGWVWESCYVSAKQRMWVNRGFMRGPFLPIYGSGAIAILIATIPVKDTPILVYICGLIGATVLEYFTGVAMEKMFHVRYWDYSYQKFNYKGHICLTSSIAWGFFSMAMIYGIHKPIEKVVLGIPQALLEWIVMGLTIVVVADFSASFKTAMELRDILDSMAHVKDEMKKLQRRAEIYEAFLSDTAEKQKEELRAEFHDLKEELRDLKEEFKDRTEDLREELSRRKDQISDQLEEFLEKQKTIRASVKNHSHRNRSIEALLKRNPGAVSGKHEELFNEYKAFIKNIRDKK